MVCLSFRTKVLAVARLQFKIRFNRYFRENFYYVIAIFS